MHDYLLLLGSDAADTRRLDNARRQLLDIGRITAASVTVHGPSVVAGDGRFYFNQALRLHSLLSRVELAAALKAIEATLGRGKIAGCPIDIDLAAEYGNAGECIWQAPDKLAHPLFVRLSRQMQPVE